jgi:WD40 repeat protein
VTAGTQLLRNEQMGYCLLYPDDLFRLDPYPAEACLVPELPAMACHSNVAQIEVSDAAGRSASQVADERIAQMGFSTERSSLTIAGEQAVVLANVPGQASMRQVLLVHNDRLYTLSFVLPDPEDPSAVGRFERLYTTAISSFTFLPAVPSPATSEASQGTRGSAVVVFVKDGDILVWDEATGQSRTIFESGNVYRVELSDDGRLVAFVRRSAFEVDGTAHHESALWVVERNGDDPRELVSAGALRQQVKASGSDTIDLPLLEWIPNSHRLLYSGSIIPDYASRGFFLIDADTLASAEIVPPEDYVLEAVPSPDGEHIGLLHGPPLEPPYFVNVDESLSGQVTYIRSTWVQPSPDGLGWTQDSTALLVKVGSRGQVFTIWRVPVDGAAAQPLITLRGEEEQLAPDGSVVFVLRSTGPFQPSERFVALLPEGLGPLAVLPSPVGLSWSPSSTAYVVGDEEMSPLCPNAAQAIEVCEPSIPFGEPIQWLEWLDRERFLYLTYVPKRLMLGSLDGSATLIAEDPQDPLSLAAVASTCRDDSEFVSDVTVPDGTPFAAGTIIQKTWHLRNTGDCAWDASYRLTFLSGDRMSGPRSAPLVGAVQPGEEVDLSVMLIAPESAGTYQGQWQLFAPDGMPFGTAPYVVIQVP